MWIKFLRIRNTFWWDTVKETNGLVERVCLLWPLVIEWLKHQVKKD